MSDTITLSILLQHPIRFSLSPLVKRLLSHLRVSGLKPVPRLITLERSSSVL